MKRNEFANIKYVEILAFWKILYQVHRTPGEPIGGILKSVGSDYALGGKLPISRGYKICLNRRTIELDERSKATVSDDGFKLISSTSKSDPSSREMRDIVKMLIYESKLSWVVFCSDDITAFKAAVPDNWEQILDDCGLFNMSDPEILKWWQALFFKYDQDKETKLKKIGEIGESLTYNLEKSRVLKDGYDPSIKVSWAASIDDSLGFDILSIHGNYYKKENESPLYIEVKSSEFTNVESFKFFISRNEWDTALSFLEDYYFYCWIGVKSNGTYDSGPYIISAIEIAPLVPEDKSEKGEWRACRMTINLSSFLKLEISD